ncbi:MAG: hypothetical protein WCE20_00515 [Rhizomicrobium sp.]
MKDFVRGTPIGVPVTDEQPGVTGCIVPATRQAVAGISIRVCRPQPANFSFGQAQRVFRAAPHGGFGLRAMLLAKILFQNLGSVVLIHGKKLRSFFCAVAVSVAQSPIDNDLHDPSRSKSARYLCKAYIEEAVPARENNCRHLEINQAITTRYGQLAEAFHSASSWWRRQFCPQHEPMGLTPHTGLMIWGPFAAGSANVGATLFRRSGVFYSYNRCADTGAAAKLARF